MNPFKLSMIITLIIIIFILLTHCSTIPATTYVPAKCPSVQAPMAPIYPLDNLTGNQPIKACVISLRMCIDYTKELNEVIGVYK